MKTKEKKKGNSQYVLKSIMINEEILEKIIKGLLKKGTVKVYKLGTFTLTRFKSSTSPLIGGKSVKKIRLSFKPSRALKVKLKGSRKK